MRVPRIWRRLYLIALVAYVALGVVFVGSVYGDSQERIGPIITTQPVIKVPTGSSDATAQAYYHYLQLRHLQQQTETYGVNPVILIIVYGILGATLLIFFTLVWTWYARQPRGQAGLYPPEVFDGYIAERGGPIDSFALTNYLVMLAFVVFTVWWNMTFGQWY
jgi:hypothetical protein